MARACLMVGVGGRLVGVDCQGAKQVGCVCLGQEVGSGELAERLPHSPRGPGVHRTPRLGDHGLRRGRELPGALP